MLTGIVSGPYFLLATLELLDKTKQAIQRAKAPKSSENNYAFCCHQISNMV